MENCKEYPGCRNAKCLYCSLLRQERHRTKALTAERDQLKEKLQVADHALELAARELTGHEEEIRGVKKMLANALTREGGGK